MVAVSINQNTRIVDERGFPTREFLMLVLNIVAGRTDDLPGSIQSFLADPTSAKLRAALSDETGTGAAVFATSPTLVTPTLGVASATTVNKVAITAPATGATLTIPDGVTLTGPAASGTAATLGNAETFSGKKTFSLPVIVPEHTVSGVPDAATYDNGVIIVSDETGGRTLATSDGSNWRRVSDGAIIS